MQLKSAALSHLGITVALPGALAGLAVAGPEGGVIGSLVGFFLGKSLQSTLWTIGAGRAS